MRLLLLGGTGFLGSELARQAVSAGLDITCLARGRSGPPVPGVHFIAADRAEDSSYAALRNHEWDAVIELSWQPGLVDEALLALSSNARHWVYVSSVSAYADHSAPNADESTPLLPAVTSPRVEISEYGGAKVACEQLTTRYRGHAALIARAGLIGGPGDRSDRSGYWVARAAQDPHAPMLVPADDGAASQVVDVRDLSAWILGSAQSGSSGVFDAVGPSMPFREWVRLSREAAGNHAPFVEAKAEWLSARGVGQYMGPDSMAMWVDESADMYGWSRRSGVRAAAAGLHHRDRREMLQDLLMWERENGLARERRAGLSATRELELIAELAAS